MNYFKFNISGKDVVIAERPSGFGEPCQDLFDSTDLSGYDSALAEIYDVNSPLRKANEDFYAERQNKMFGEILRDTIENGYLGHVGERFYVKYTSHAGLPNQLVQEVLAPSYGYWVPTKDGLFFENTLIPFETVLDRKEAMRRLESHGFDPNYVSQFYRLDNYNDLKFVARFFIPDNVGNGRFSIDANWHPSDSGYGIIGARLKHTI